jgi:hypothetical protein
MKWHLFLFLLFVYSLCCAHENVEIEHKFSHLTLKSSTCFYTEEINRNLIVGEYFNSLIFNLDISNSIELTLLQGSIEDQGIYVSNNINEFDLKIVLINRNFKVDKTLFLLHLILDDFQKGNINTSKKYNWDMELKNTETETVLSQKIYRPAIVLELGNSHNFNYYYQNNSFHIEQRQQGQTSQIYRTPTIHQFTPISNQLLVIVNENQDGTILEYNHKNPNKISVYTFRFPKSPDRCLDIYKIGYFSNHILFGEPYENITHSFSMETKEFKANISF